MAILCHHLNGKRDIAIVKSELTRINALKKNLPLYLENLKSINTTIEVLDQERDSVDSIFQVLRRFYAAKILDTI